jgi:hypothetical protein
MKKALCFGIVLFLMILSFTGCQSGADVLSTWTGTYAGGAYGTIPSWKIYDDNTTVGVWTDHTGAFSIDVSGSYTLNGTAFTFAASGTATNPGATPTTSTYTVSGSGTLESATGSGSYSIAFAELSWGGPYSGTWSLTTK